VNQSGFNRRDAAVRRAGFLGGLGSNASALPIARMDSSFHLPIVFESSAFQRPRLKTFSSADKQT